MKEKTSGKIFRFIGIWDLLLTLPFALPAINGFMIEILKTLNGYLSPHIAFSEFSPLHLFFVQLFGILAALWAIVRIHNPDSYLATYDTIGRAIVGICMVSFTLSGGSRVPLLFSISEFGFGIVQFVFLVRVKKGK